VSADVNKGKSFSSLFKNRSVIASYVYTPATRENCFNGVIIERRMKSVLQKKIFPLNKFNAHWFWYFLKLLEK
jgi:hypothetical protein